jgi:hypothetical protein
MWRQSIHAYTGQAEQFGRFEAGVAGENIAVLVGQNRREKPERLDAFSKRPDLRLCVLASILRGRPKIGQIDKLKPANAVRTIL